MRTKTYAAAALLAAAALTLTACGSEKDGSSPVTVVSEEAGAENICCIANSLSVDPSSIRELYVALKELDAFGAISTEFRLDRALLESDLGMSYGGGTWCWPGDGPIPEVFLTDAGQVLATE